MTDRKTIRLIAQEVVNSLSNELMNEFAEKIAEKVSKQIIEEITGRLEEATDKYEALLNRVVAPQQPKPKADLHLLTDKQRQVFEKIALIKGNSRKAQLKIEKLLHELSGEKATEALVTATKDALKDRGLGVLCSCGEAAQIVWQRNARNVEGGHVILSHHGKGKKSRHNASTIFPKFTVVPKPDLRKRNS